jgi:tripartite-type tricarboxylate transporter receptor subunit TctC
VRVRGGIHARRPPLTLALWERGFSFGAFGLSFFRTVVLGACLTLACALTCAADYPTRNARFIIPFAPGGTNDVLPRMLAQHLMERWGKAFIVENRPGAGGVIANDIVAKANPDGHTLLVTNPAFAMSASLYKTLPYDVHRDFTPVTELLRGPSVLVINPAVGAQTLKDFIALARAQPGKFNYGSGGYGSALHLYSELFKKAAHVNITHVPFKGGVDNMTALLGGQVQMNIIQYQANVLELIRSGRLRALAVTTDGRRSKSLPDTPSMSEAGLHGMAIYVWGGVLGPAKLPAAITHKLQGEIARLLVSPAVKERFAAQDAEMIGSRPEAFAKVLQSEIQRWREVIQSAGITAQ